MYLFLQFEEYVTLWFFFFFLVAPALYPQEVDVTSKDASSVVVSWRGVSTGQAEDSLKGYVVSDFV